MQIVFHIGAHCTDEGQVLSGLSANRAVLRPAGVAVPAPGLFRPNLREALAATNGRPASPQTQRITLETILSDAQPRRVVFCNDAFLCSVQTALEREALYVDAGPKCKKLANLFCDHEVEFCIAIRNPATFLPACFSRTGGDSFEAFLAQVDPLRLRWSSVIARISQENPGIPLTVWSNEDTPFIWYDILAALAGLPDSAPLTGHDDFLAAIMKPEGLERIRDYLEKHPTRNVAQRQRILNAFLDKFEKDDDVRDAHAPIWTPEYVQELTETYEEDLYIVERLPGVTFLSP